jgi:3-isopropylmalate dehydratase small subunit
VDLEAQTVTLASGREVPFAIDPTVRENLLHGWDDVALTLNREAEITAYEEERERPGPVTTAL